MRAGNRCWELWHQTTRDTMNTRNIHVLWFLYTDCCLSTMLYTRQGIIVQGNHLPHPYLTRKLMHQWKWEHLVPFSVADSADASSGLVQLLFGGILICQCCPPHKNRSTTSILTMDRGRDNAFLPIPYDGISQKNEKSTPEGWRLPS